VWAFSGAAWRLVAPYWQSEERWRARLLLGVIVALTLGLVFILVQLNEWNREFYEALQNHDFAAFGPLLLRFTAYASVYIIGAVYKLYFTQMLEMRWRVWLTRHFVTAWLSEHVYYHLELQPRGTDNPDQRIAEDLRLFTTSTLELSLGLLSSGVTLASFVVILFTISGDLEVGGVTIPGYMVWAALAYALGGSLVARWIGGPLIGLNFRLQRNEADFRFNLVRIREHAEGVAFYRGERVESAGLMDAFERIRLTWWALMVATKRLMFFSVGYNQVAVIFPILVAAPRYFSGEISLGVLMQIANAFGQVQGALSWFVDSYRDLASWKASTDRLLTFQNGIREALVAARHPDLVVRHEQYRAIRSECMDLCLPTGRQLLTNASFSFEPGDRVMVTGPNGCGKSTLFRAIASIWPFGRGVISVPANAHMLFLPQRPYLPIASLRAAVSYPARDGEFPDCQIDQALEAVGLGRFRDQLSEIQDWGARMSGGELQRMAFARVLLHRPDWVFLDEATSALDEAGERQMYELLERHVPRSTVVSIAHRPQVAAFHLTHFPVQAPSNPT
jgi:putative ATP-binding cassette transporter